MLPVANLAEAGVEKPCQEKHHYGLGNLRRLKGKKIAESDPAVRVMRVWHEKNQDQEHRGGAQRRIDEARRVVVADVHVHQHHQRQHSDDGPDGLGHDERIRRVVFFLIHHGRGGEDHHQASNDQHHGREKQPLVHSDEFRHKVL